MLVCASLVLYTLLKTKIWWRGSREETANVARENTVWHSVTRPWTAAVVGATMILWDWISGGGARCGGGSSLGVFRLWLGCPLQRLAPSPSWADGIKGIGWALPKKKVFTFLPVTFTESSVGILGYTSIWAGLLFGWSVAVAISVEMLSKDIRNFALALWPLGRQMLHRWSQNTFQFCLNQPKI